MQENKNSTEDLKTLRNYALGVAGFGTTISAILIQALHFPAEPTLLCVIAFALLMLLVVFLIGRAESRGIIMLNKHTKESEKVMSGLGNRLDKIDDVLLDIQASTLRTEMNNEIHRNPQNHDTIIRMAEKYFGKREDGGLGANWVEKEIFLTWQEDEHKAGRDVHLPKSLIIQLEND